MNVRQIRLLDNYTNKLMFVVTIVSLYVSDINNCRWGEISMSSQSVLAIKLYRVISVNWFWCIDRLHHCDWPPLYTKVLSIPLLSMRFWGRCAEASEQLCGLRLVFFRTRILRCSDLIAGTQYYWKSWLRYKLMLRFRDLHKRLMVS